MTKNLLFIALSLFIFSEKGFSWGRDGHQMTAMVALKYMDENNMGEAADKVRAVADQIVAKYYIGKKSTELLSCRKDETLKECETYKSVAAAAIFPDEVKHTDTAFKDTAPWHFINTDLDHYDIEAPFLDQNKKGGNVIGDLYIMINAFKYYLKSLHTTGIGTLDVNGRGVLAVEDWAKNCEARFGCEAEALSFLIHFVGDMHQPLHVSRLCDSGGNKVTVTINGKSATSEEFPYSLHTAWDDYLLLKNGFVRDHSDLSFVDRVYKSPDYEKDIRIWLAQTDPAEWANESLAYAPKVYNFQISASNQNSFPAVPRNSYSCNGSKAVPDLGANYYSFAAPVIDQRILQGGLRLAVILNSIYGAEKN